MLLATKFRRYLLALTFRLRLSVRVAAQLATVRPVRFRPRPMAQTFPFRSMADC